MLYFLGNYNSSWFEGDVGNAGLDNEKILSSIFLHNSMSLKLPQ